MAGKSRKQRSETKYELLGIFFVTIGILSLISIWGFNVGSIGSVLGKFLQYMFGIGAMLIPLLIMLIGGRYIFNKTEIIFSKRFVGIILLYIAVLALYHHFSVTPGNEIMPENLKAGGGLLGGFILFVMRKFFGVDGTLLILLSLILGSILLSTTWSLAKGLLATRKKAVDGMQVAKNQLESTYEKVKEKEIFHHVTDIPEIEDNSRRDFYNQDNDEFLPPKPQTVKKKAVLKPKIKIEEHSADNKEKPQKIKSDFLDSFEQLVQAEEARVKVPQPVQKKLDTITQNKSEQKTVEQPEPLGYQVPLVVDILKKVEKTVNRQLKQEISDKAQVLVETLDNFKVKAKIINACHGPAVTRYELEPAPGVKVSKIVGLADDLALSLAASGIRIEAPIPGKAAIGIEVPNKELEGVHLREVLEQEAFQNAKSKLTVGLGKDISGQAIFADLAKMPHLMVAGATGSGKSVCINTLITSILFKAKPDEVKFVLIDPKMVELSTYNGIPHLMVPVVTDAKKAASVLNWAVQEMEKRYALFAATGVRDMGRYNNANETEKMPAVVIIIDELADLMMVAAHDVEDAICRLAQKARAAGIHLVLATQRPSVDVITGVIKANIPSRISFSVSSQIDSRTILDSSGAEKLLGKGDMLYYPVGAAKPLRVQGAFVSDAEVESLIEYIKAQGEAPEENEEIISFTEQAVEGEGSAEDKNVSDSDELLKKAVDMVIDAGQASASMLQRRLKIGYARAGRLVDMMESMQIISEARGSKAREVLMTREEVEKTYFDK